jgi:hypothetical protein
MFTAISPGLAVSADGASITKPTSEKGVKISDASPTSLTTTNAFCARLRTSAAEDDPRTVANAAAAWRLRFSLSSESSQPSVLVGAAVGHAEPNGESQREFDARVLGSPMLWYEPHSVMLECRNNGAYLWSDTLSLFSVKAFEKCFSVGRRDTTRSPVTESPHAPLAARAVVDVEYLPLAGGSANCGRVSFRLADDEGAAGGEAHVDVPWVVRSDGDALHPVCLLPHVTLMEAGDTVGASFAA